MLHRIRSDIFRIISDYIYIQQLLDLDWNKISLRSGKDWNRIVQSLSDIQAYHHCANSYNNSFYEACKLGNWKLVDFLIEKGAQNWNLGLECASCRGHQDLEEFFQQKINESV